MSGFVHPSRPGYYGTAFSDRLRAQVAVLCDALVPGDEGYPSASVADVPRFIEERSGPDDVTRFEALAARWTLGSVDEATAGLMELEASDPVEFGWLRGWVYHGYYAAHRVLAAMNERGYDYHGAPQPLGYRLPGETPRPARARGSYIPTAEVTRASS